MKKLTGAAASVCLAVLLAGCSGGGAKPVAPTKVDEAAKAGATAPTAPQDPTAAKPNAPAAGGVTSGVD